MLRLDRVIRPWKESAALNSQINLYCFWNEQAFLTEWGPRDCPASAWRRLRKPRPSCTRVCRKEARSRSEDIRSWISHLSIPVQDEPARDSLPRIRRPRHTGRSRSEKRGLLGKA